METMHWDQESAGEDWITIFNEGESGEDSGPGEWLSDMELLP